MLTFFFGFSHGNPCFPDLASLGLEAISGILSGALTWKRTLYGVPFLLGVRVQVSLRGALG